MNLQLSGYILILLSTFLLLHSKENGMSFLKSLVIRALLRKTSKEYYKGSFEFTLILGIQKFIPDNKTKTITTPLVTVICFFFIVT